MQQDLNYQPCKRNSNAPQENLHQPQLFASSDRPLSFKGLFFSHIRATADCSFLPLLPPNPLLVLAGTSRWARSWPWAGSAPRRPLTGASSETSSWLGSSRCPWPACSAPPSWRCSSTAFCPSSEGTPPGGRAEEEGESEKGSMRERERERGKRSRVGLEIEARVSALCDRAREREEGDAFRGLPVRWGLCRWGDGGGTRVGALNAGWLRWPRNLYRLALTLGPLFILFWGEIEEPATQSAVHIWQG